MKGTIRKRGDSWTVIIDIPRDPETGKRRRKRITADTKKEAERLAREILASIDAGGFAEADADKITVEEYLTRWLAYAQQTLRHRSHRRYSEMVRLHVVPKVGTMKLGKLKPLDLQTLYADRLAKLSPSTVNNLHIVLHRALKQAVRWGLLIRNPADSVDPPRKAAPKCNIWNESQVGAFLAVADKHEFAALWRLALFTGMRQGEILALRWGDVDLARKVLSVRHTLSRGAEGSLEFGEPKTAAGRRSIALPTSVVQALNRHRARQAEMQWNISVLHDEHGIVFATREGKPLHPNNLTRWFRELSASAGVPRIRFHDLRHTSATLMLAQGVHPKIVQERLGHANISMTLDRYSHVTMDMQRQAADQLDALLGS